MQSTRLWWWLVPLLLVTFWLGAHFLDLRMIWQDEFFSITDSGSGTRTIVEVWQGVAERNPWHPPGYFILLSGWGKLVGWEPPILRALALIFGLFAVAWTYRLGADHVSRKVGLFGAVILGTTVMLTYYLDQLRVYSLLPALAAYTVWLYLSIIRRRAEPTIWHWAGLLIGVTCLLYAHYFGAVIPAAIGLYHLIFVRKNRRWWITLGVLAGAGVLFLPWVRVLILGLNQFFGPNEFQGRALDTGELLKVLGDLLGNGSIGLLAIVLVLALLARKRGAWRIWFFAAATLMPFLLLNAIFHAIPITRIRYLLMVWPFFTLLIALGLTTLERWQPAGRWAALALLLVWVGIGIANISNPDLIGGLGGAQSIFPIQRMIRDLRAQMTVDDLVVTYWPTGSTRPNRNEINYYHQQLLSDPVLVSSDGARLHDVPHDHLTESNRLWLAYMPERPVEEPESFDRLQSVLASDYQQCRVFRNDPDMRLVLYARAPICCGLDDLPPLARFGGDMIKLDGAQGPASPVTNSARFWLNWEIAPNVPLEVYSITLQIFDGSGSKVGQSDYGLPPGSFLCRASDLDTSSLEAGTYEVRAGIYAWQTQERLTGVSRDGAQAELIPVGTMQIAAS